MNRDRIFALINRSVDQLANALVPNGGALTLLAKAILYILILVAAPILLITSFPWLIGIILFVLLALFALSGGIPIQF